MNYYKKSFLALSLLCLLFTFNVGLAQEDSSLIQQKIEGFNLEGFSEGGDKTWDINGEEADVLGDEVAVKKVNANAYGQEDMNLKADKGTLHRASGKVFLQDNVVITAERGAVMKTESLEWQRQEDLVTTDDHVTIEDGDIRLQGMGMEARPELQSARIKRDVMADIKTQSKDHKENRIQITSDGPMEIDQVSKVAVFTINVVAIEVATGRQLNADRMEVSFDSDTRKIKQIFCKGNVQVTQDSNVTRSDELIYLADEQRMLLKGRPQLMIDMGDHNAGEAFKI